MTWRGTTAARLGFPMCPKSAHRRIDGALELTNPGTSRDRGYAVRPASDVISLLENERGFDNAEVEAVRRLNLPAASR